MVLLHTIGGEFDGIPGQRKRPSQCQTTIGSGLSTHPTLSRSPSTIRSIPEPAKPRIYSSVSRKAKIERSRASFVDGPSTRPAGRCARSRACGWCRRTARHLPTHAVRAVNKWCVPRQTTVGACSRPGRPASTKPEARRPVWSATKVCQTRQCRWVGQGRTEW